jgi:hypothetical protein
MVPIKKHKLLLYCVLVLLIFPACLYLDDPVGSVSAKRNQLMMVQALTKPSSDMVTIRVSYQYNSQDPDPLKITCVVDGEDGPRYDTRMVPVTESGETSYTIKISKPGNYKVTCTANGKPLQYNDTFQIQEQPSQPNEPVDEQKPGDQPEGTVKIPKPGDFATAGMWMYFDKATSDVAGYSVPRQCLPGVNYTQAGGSSSFDIDLEGNMTGACELTYYDGAERLTGTMKGTWNGETNEMTFRVETRMEYTATVNHQSGTLVNATVYEFSGVLTWNSEMQAAGTAQWHNECESSNPDAVICFNMNYKAELTANGDVPFVINFNP